MKAFGKFVEATITQAGREAEAERSTTIEAQHVLLAIAAQPQTPPAQLLSSVGLDHRALRSALDREFEHSLSVAGVALGAFELAAPSAAPQPATQLGSSVRQAIERGVQGVEKGLQPAHLLLGILQAEVGTVPRALALAGIDRTELLARVRQAATPTWRE
ncbi:MAG TPA: Clp protease N-terminal domain-containing protein [Polyangiaceae bacterium]|nr:Clp protease N-terminal domain-containing protein [Polyangiaceae bacterium]